jgi:hypothetical protein
VASLTKPRLSERKRSGARTRCATSKCQVVIVGKAGDSPCVGNVSGPGTVWTSSGDPPAKGYSCNLDRGLRCDATTQACAAVGPIGSACSTDDQCALHSYCEGGHCEAQTATGGACTDSRACDGGSCEGGTCKSNDLGWALFCGG